MTNHFNAIRQEKNGRMEYSFPACLFWLESEGKQRFGSHFRIEKADQRLLYKLLVYAIGDRENMIKLGLSPHKGILLSGPVGCGKTTLMTLISQFFPRLNQYAMVSARSLSLRFAIEGYGVISQYSTQSFKYTSGGYLPNVYCFDDVGTERPMQYYGNDCNVLGEILLARYDHFVKKGMLTHITTNLSASKLEELYGNRLRSRMREMFNLVAFSADSNDKRQ